MLTILGGPLCRGRVSTPLLASLKSLVSPTARYLQSESSAYAGPGMTTVRVLNDEDAHLNIVNTYSSNGFRLSNNLYISGSIILFPTHVFAWTVTRGSDITLDSLRLFDLIVPKVKIVIIGYGHKDEPHDSSLPLQLKKKGISCEFLPTPQAITTYNFLVSDAVHVAGAFVTHNKIVKTTPIDYVNMRFEDYLYKDKDALKQLEDRDSEEYYKPMLKKILTEGKDKKSFDE